ncbi:MAG: DUF454 family protein [Pseudomonadales bacterium]|nr:DUF454 family protein [Pseudomonadales bacterium]
MKPLSQKDPASLLIKAGLLLLAALCLLIGVVGIVLPIIPGILFLGLGAWLLARVSGRAAASLEAQPAWHRARRFWLRSRHLGIVGKMHLAVLLLGKSLVDSLRKISD